MERKYDARFKRLSKFLWAMDVGDWSIIPCTRHSPTVVRNACYIAKTRGRLFAATEKDMRRGIKVTRLA